ncbi:MAG: hypothetical protein GX222_05475 [Ruminococcaceae bacterium]|nr:hypothetical protein [Oscillospiraceae bacterium]
MSVNKKDYCTTIRRQVLSLGDLVEQQVENGFDVARLKELIPDGMDFDNRTVIMTGAGDCWAAAGVMKTLMSKFLDPYRCLAPDAMEFARVMTAEDLAADDKNKPLLITMSVGGGTARVVEATKKGQELGFEVIVITNKPESRVGKSNEKVFPLNLPPSGDYDTPGLRSYFALLMALAGLAYRIGVVRGLVKEDEVEKVKAEIIKYVKNYDFEKCDDEMFALAKDWKKFEKFDFLGDDSCYYSALFGAEKFYEMSGTLNEFDDTENWNHIDNLLSDPEEVGTVLNIDSRSNSYDRAVDTANRAKEFNRPVLVITDGDKNDFLEGITVCSIPKAPENYSWMISLVDFIPASLLSGFHGKLNGRLPFNSFDDKTGIFDPSTPFNDPDIVTRGSSKVEIHI